MCSELRPTMQFFVVILHTMQNMDVISIILGRYADQLRVSFVIIVFKMKTFSGEPLVMYCIPNRYMRHP